MTGIDLLFFGSMALGAVLGFVIGFYLRYRWEKRQIRREGGQRPRKPSAEQCLGAGVYGSVAGALWWLIVPAAVIGGSLWLLFSGLMWFLSKTGKFDD